jgi:uncharacterized protein YbjT (DUF2867 family)
MILVTGATGKNGVEIIKRLSGKGKSVRAMVHSLNGFPSNTPNVEFLAADFDDAASLRKVLDGVDRAFLVTNSSERVEERQLRFVDVARDAGVKHIVYLSQLHAAKDSPLRFLRYHAVVEEALRSSGMAYTNLRPNLYMQGLLMIGRSIASEGRFFAPAGECRVSVVDVRDIAAVAGAALTESGHEAKTYDLTGPEALTHAEMATKLSEALNRPVTLSTYQSRQCEKRCAVFTCRTGKRTASSRTMRITVAARPAKSPPRSKMSQALLPTRFRRLRTITAMPS